MSLDVAHEIFGGTWLAQGELGNRHFGPLCGVHCGIDGSVSPSVQHCAGCHTRTRYGNSPTNHGNAVWAVPLGVGPGAWVVKQVKR